MTKSYVNIEKIVAKIEGTKKGNAFLIDKQRAVTVKHCIPENAKNVKLIFLKMCEGVVIERDATVSDQFNPEEDGLLVLELDNELPTPNINVVSKQLNPFEEVAVFGYDANFLAEGRWTKLEVASGSIPTPDMKQDLSFNVINNKETDFSGLSGSPIVIGNSIVGIVSQETLENSKAISIHGISVKTSADFFKRYDIEVREFIEETDYSFDANMTTVEHRGKSTYITVGGEQEIQSRLHGIYKAALTEIVNMHRRGDVDGAWEKLKNQIIELDKDKFVSDETKAEYYYRMAIWFVEDRGDIGKAQKRYEKAKILNPKIDDCVFQALKLFRNGECQNAEDVLEPIDSTAKFNVYLQICINEHKIEKAYEKYEEVDQIMDFDNSTYYLLSIMEILRHEYGSAMEYIEKAIEIDKKIPFYHMIKGSISYWKAIPQDLCLTNDLHPVMFVNGLFNLKVENQQLIKQAVENYREAYRLAENVENIEQMEVILSVWVNALSVDSVFQNEIKEPLQLLKNRDSFNATVLLYSIQKGLELPDEVTVENLENHIKKIKNKISHVIVLIELCFSMKDKKNAKRILHEYKSLFFNGFHHEYWYEQIVRIENDKDILRSYEEEIKDNTNLEEIRRKRLIALIIQRDEERDQELEILLKELFEETSNRLDLLNLIYFSKTRRKWKKMQKYSEILFEKYDDVYGCMYKIQSLMEQCEYETALTIVEDLKKQHISGTEFELLRNEMRIYERLGKYAQAIDVGNKLLKSKPTEQNVLNLASLYALNGDEMESLNILLKAEDYNISTVTIYQRISMCYLTKDDRKAWEYAKKAVDLSDEQPEIMLWAMGIASRIGKSNLAGEYYHRVMMTNQSHQLLTPKSLDEALEIIRKFQDEAERNLQKYYDGELPSHLLVDASRGDQTYAEFFYSQWNVGDMAPCEFGAHYYEEEKLDLNIRELILDYSSCMLFNEMQLLEILCENVEKIYVVGDLFGIMSEEIRNIPEKQSDRIIQRYQFVNKCKDEYHIEFVEIKAPENLDGIDAKKKIDTINSYTAKYYNAVRIDDDEIEDGIRDSEVVVALYKSGKITQETYEEYAVKEAVIREEKVQEVLSGLSKVIVSMKILSKWEKFYLLPVIITNFTVITEKTMENSAIQEYNLLERNKRICKQVENLKNVLQQYNQQGKIGFLPIQEEQDGFTYSNMLKTLMIAAETKQIPLIVDDRVVTSYSKVGKAPIYNMFDIMKILLLSKKIRLEEYCGLWKKAIDKKIRYVIPDNQFILYALKISEVDEERLILKESEMLRTIRKYVVESLSADSFLSNKYVSHVKIPEREYYIFYIQSQSRELIKLIWKSEMEYNKKTITSGWVLSHYSQFAFDFGQQVNEKGRKVNHAIQLADFIIAGILLSSDEIRTKEYYKWLYGWIDIYLKKNPDIKQKTLNYTKEFISSHLIESSRKMDKREAAAVKLMFSIGIYYMPNEYKVHLLKDTTISQVFNSIYSQISIVLTQKRQVPATLFKSWETDVLMLNEKMVLSKMYDNVNFEFSWKYIIPALPGIIVKWKEGNIESEQCMFMEMGERLKHNDKNVRKKEFQYVLPYIENMQYGRSYADLLSFNKYKKGAEDIIQLLEFSEEFQLARIKKGITLNWLGNKETWKFILPSNSNYFKQFYDFDVNPNFLDNTIAWAVPVPTDITDIEKINNCNPVRLLNELESLLFSNAKSENVMLVINALFSYSENVNAKYGALYIIFLKYVWLLFQELDAYKSETKENLLIWTYIWADKMMSGLYRLKEEEKINLEAFVEELERNLERDNIEENIDDADILSPCYMNLFRLCVTGTLSICCNYKEKMQYMGKDILIALNKCYRAWLNIPSHFCEAELLHKDIINVHGTIFAKNVYTMIEELAKIGNCVEAFMEWKQYGGVVNRRQNLLKNILEDEKITIYEILYMFIISRESITEEDAIIIQKVIKKHVIEQVLVIEENRYRILAQVVNKLPKKFQDEYLSSEFAKVGNMLISGEMEWSEVESIVIDIIPGAELNSYLSFWEKYADALDSNSSLLLAESIGWMQYNVPFEYINRMRELRMRLELAS